MNPQAIYDRADALERLGGDEELMSSVAALFVEDSAGYCDALDEALRSGDAATVQREAHTVKSMLATFSYEAGRAPALQLERLAASGSLDGAEALTAEVIAAVRRLAAVLAAEVAA